MRLPAMASAMNRRLFLQQSFAFSLLAGSAARGLGIPANATASHALILGDWGWNGDLAPQTAVARAMAEYVAKQKIKLEALLLLGDSFYGALPGVGEGPALEDAIRGDVSAEGVRLRGLHGDGES